MAKDVNPQVLEGEIKHLKELMTEGFQRTTAAFDRIEKQLRDIIQNQESLRADVNQANSRGVDNKVKIEQLDKRVTTVEDKVDGRIAVEAFLKWLVGLIGISGVAAMLVTLSS